MARWLSTGIHGWRIKRIVWTMKKEMMIPDSKFEGRKIFNDCKFFKIFVENFYFFFWRGDIERYFCWWFLLLLGINGPLLASWPGKPKTWTVQRSFWKVYTSIRLRKNKKTIMGAIWAFGSKGPKQKSRKCHKIVPRSVRRSVDWKSLVLKTDKEFSTSWFLEFDEVYLMIPSRGSNCVTVCRKWH